MIRSPIAFIGVVVVIAIAAHAQPASSGANPDQRFADNAAAAGIAEVDAAKLALQKSHNDKVRHFAQRMVRDHTMANRKLEALAEKEHINLPSAPSAADQEAINRLQGLTGKDFDNVYLQDQLIAHQEAVALFTGESQSGKDAQLKHFAATTLPTLREHLKMVQGLAPKS